MAESSHSSIFQKDVGEQLRESLCQSEDQWLRWCDWLSRPPLWTVLRVNSHRVSLGEAKACLQSFLLEHSTSHSDHHHGTSVTEHPALNDVLLVACPPTDPAPQPTEKQVIVGRQCGVAVLRGSNVFAPGILAMNTGVQKGDTISVFADVQGLCRRGLTKPFDGPVRFVGNGRAELSRYALFHTEMPSGLAISMTQPLYASPPLNGLFPDTVFAQNLPSVVACHVLAPQPGEIILDMCAAPGGKTTHIASLMKNEGVVVALDKSAARLKLVENNCARLGVSCVRTYAFDGRKSVASPSAECPIASAGLSSPPFPPESFDRVLVDAPCSALGQRPQIKCSMSGKELRSFPAYQRQIFEKAVQLLRPGGVLVFCTCTLTIEENEGNVAWALEHFPCLELTQQTPHLGQAGFVAGGLTQAQASLVQRFVDPSTHQLEPVVASEEQSSSTDSHAAGGPPTSDDTSRSASSHVDRDTIGFFIAKFIKQV